MLFVLKYKDNFKNKRSKQKQKGTYQVDIEGVSGGVDKHSWSRGECAVQETVRTQILHLWLVVLTELQDQAYHLSRHQRQRQPNTTQWIVSIQQWTGIGKGFKLWLKTPSVFNTQN